MNQATKEEGKGAWLDMEKSISDRGNRPCKGPEVRTSKIAVSEPVRGEWKK